MQPSGSRPCVIRESQDGIGSCLRWCLAWTRNWCAWATKNSTMVWYRGCVRRLQKYFAARGAEEFSLDVAMAWVDQACGSFGEARPAP